jgi:hypothetical protein
MPAHHWDVVQGRGVAHPLERGPAGGLVTHERVDDRERHRPHGGDVVDVREDRGDAGAEWIPLQEGRQDGLAAHDERGAVGVDDRPVVAGPAQPVGGAEHVADDADVLLGAPAGAGAHGGDQGVEPRTVLFRIVRHG